MRLANRTGANVHLKVGCLVAGMAAAADSIEDMDVLRHGAISERLRDLFAGSGSG